MKILEKFVLILYSFLVLIISTVICLIIFNIINIDNIKNCIDFILADTSLTIITLASAIVCILLSIRCLFFRKKKQIKKSTSTDILLENDSGRLLISKNAIENAVRNIVKDKIELTDEVKVTVDIDPANNLSVYIAILLCRNIKIRELTIDLQQKIKDEIKENFGLDVKQVNIKVDSNQKDVLKNIENNKQKINQKDVSQNKQLESSSIKNKTEENIEDVKIIEEIINDENEKNIIEIKKDEVN